MKAPNATDWYSYASLQNDMAWMSNQQQQLVRESTYTSLKSRDSIPTTNSIHLKWNTA